MPKHFFKLIIGLVILGMFAATLPSFEGFDAILKTLQTNREPVTLVAVGDIMMDRAVRDHMNKYGLDYPFQKLDRRFFQDADILLGNLEGPIVAKKTNFGHLTFGMLPDIIPVLKDFGFDVFALANNHGLDQGWTGHDSTKQFLSAANIGWFGHPKGILREENAYYFYVKDKAFAFVGLEDVFKEAGKEAQAIENIKNVIPEIKKKADYVIVSPHWGVEYTKKPSARQIILAHAFIDAGVDIIIGHHPHVVQEKELYQGKWIYYSLGNFIFDQYWSKETQKGLVLRITLQDGKIGVEEFPIESIRSQPALQQLIN